MATKKITIAFNGLPALGGAFSYRLSLNGNYISYTNGQNYLQLIWTSTVNNPLYEVQLKSNLNDSINNLLTFMQTNWQHPNITYARVNDTIEVTININYVVVANINTSNIYTNLIVSDIVIGNTPKLKYFIEWKDPECIDYLVRIYQKGFTGTETQVFGYGVLKYGTAKDNLDPIRGNGLDLNLEATNDLTLEDLYTEEENQFTVKMYRQNELLFDGFLKPDGVYQSFVYDRWLLNLSCVDGLGILKDLAFVQPTGFHWTGKMKAIDIIYNCLVRSNLSMNINTAVNIYYEGLTASDTLDPLAQIYISVDRFVKDDKDTIMDCQDVLKSILTLFNANICQIAGQWYIYRVNELYDNPNIKFRQYSKTDNSYLGLNSKNLGFNLGSQIDNYYPHHCGANQQIQIKGSVTAARINYKYGFLKGLMPNKDLVRNSSNIYTGYTIETANIANLSFPSNDAYGIFLKKQSGVSYALLLTATGIPLLVGNTFDFKITLTNTNDSFAQYIFTVNVDNYYLTNSGDWVSSPSIPLYLVYECNNGTQFFKTSAKAMPTGGNVIIKVYSIQFGSTNKIYEIESIDIVNTTNSNNGAVGEFHTVQRKNRPSSISTDTTEIYNGDSLSLIYEGAIYKQDQTNRTAGWFRRFRTEIKPVLEIAGEDILRMSQKPAKIFIGDVYGYLPYLSIISINNIDGVFMPIEWSFDAKSNVTTVKLLEAFNDELYDIDYKYTLDYGSTVKPTITS